MSPTPCPLAASIACPALCASMISRVVACSNIATAPSGTSSVPIGGFPASGSSPSAASSSSNWPSGGTAKLTNCARDLAGSPLALGARLHPMPRFPSSPPWSPPVSANQPAAKPSPTWPTRIGPGAPCMCNSTNGGSRTARTTSPMPPGSRCRRGCKPAPIIFSCSRTTSSSIAISCTTCTRGHCYGATKLAAPASSTPACANSPASRGAAPSPLTAARGWARQPCCFRAPSRNSCSATGSRNPRAWSLSWERWQRASWAPSSATGPRSPRPPAAAGRPTAPAATRISNAIGARPERTSLAWRPWRRSAKPPVMSAEAKTQLLRLPQVSDYELIRCVGSGAFGDVWLARAKATNRFRAIKLVSRSRFPQASLYETEFTGLKKFEELSREHAGFIDILHVSRDDQAGCFSYVMELADDLEAGQSFDPGKYVSKTVASELGRRQIAGPAGQGRFTPAECVEAALNITAALSTLHQNGLAHRDIKPSNIVFVRGLAKLADVGLVTDLKLKADDGTLIGSPTFMDEQAHGTAQGDLFCFCKVLYMID